MKNIDSIFESFVKNFVLKSKQERTLGFFKAEKNWGKITAEFHTSRIFNKKYLQEINPNEQYSESIYETLIHLGMNENCYSLLDYLEGNDYKCKLSPKLGDSVGFLIETIIYCPNSNLGFYEGGHAKDRYILNAK